MSANGSLAPGVDSYEVLLFLGGLAALLAAWLPAYTARRPLSLPMVLVGIGALAVFLHAPFPDLLPSRHVEVVERLTEATVIVALLGSGLKIDRPFGWRSWRLTWWMLGVVMPLSIAATTLVALAATPLGLGAALLVGAALAPTDPVLASDVQVGEPMVTTADDADEDALDPDVEPEDDVRFTLTSEGGLNDALAFPFVYLAIRAVDGLGTRDMATWLAWDVVGRIAIGASVGWLVGALLARVAFRPPSPLVALAETPQGFVAIAIALLAYGAAEIAQGYGFLAVFVAAVALRSAERHHSFHRELHGLAEQTENLFTVGLLLLLGASVAQGAIGRITWGGIAVAVALVAVIRPVAGWLALRRSALTGAERWTIAFFGIRGFGSVYYLAYGLSATTIDGASELWGIVVVAILVSIVVHGIAATPVMRQADRAAHRRLRRPYRGSPRRVPRRGWRT